MCWCETTLHWSTVQNSLQLAKYTNFFRGKYITEKQKLLCAFISFLTPNDIGVLNTAFKSVNEIFKGVRMLLREPTVDPIIT